MPYNLSGKKTAATSDVMHKTSKERYFLYAWQGVTSNGQRQYGRLYTSDAMALRQQLQKQDICLVQFSRKKVHPSRCSLQHWIFRLEQLGFQVKAGIPLLSAVRQQMQVSQRDKEFVFWSKLYDNLSEGHSLSQGLGRSSLTEISPMSISLIALAEQTGELSTILKLVSHWLEEQKAIKQRLLKPLRYPLIVLSITTFMLLIMLVKIVPIFATLYQQGSQELPTITLSLFALSHWIIEAPLRNIGLMLVTFMIGFYAWRTRSMWSHRLPFFGQLISSSEHIVMLKTLALAQECGLPLDKTLELMGNRSRYLRFDGLLVQLKEGLSISELMKRHSKISSHSAAIITNGEQTGLLSEAFHQAAQFEQQRLERWSARLELYMEPLLMVGLSVILGTIILALYLPIFDLGQSL